jgi:uncharacterized protein
LPAGPPSPAHGRLTSLVPWLAFAAGMLLLLIVGRELVRWIDKSSQKGSIRFAMSKAAAEKGDPLAQNRVGVCYARGWGVATNWVEAARWWRRAAEQGLPMAEYSLGYCYAAGQGVPKDETEAMRWWHKAAAQDLAVAQYSLGYHYSKGQGVRKDEPEAVKWYRKAADSGLTNAFNNLAWILATSQDPAVRDGAAAVFYAEKAVAARQRQDAMTLDTLAAAYAELGDFEKAVKTQEEVVALPPTGKEPESDYRSRLKLYRDHVPYREKK